MDLGPRARPDPGVPATAVPRWSPSFASLAPGGLARRPLHRPGCSVVHDSALAREGTSASDWRSEPLPCIECGTPVGRGSDAVFGRSGCRDLAACPLPPGEGDECKQIKWFASAAALSLVRIIVFGGGFPPRTARGNRRLVEFTCHSLGPHRYGHRHPALS